MANLKNLIKYYLDCLSKDFEQGFSEFARDNLGYGLRYGQLSQLPFIETENNIYDSEDIRGVLQRTIANRKLTLYLGYPIYCNIFTARNGNQYHMLEPLFLFKYERETVTNNGTPTLENAVPLINPNPISKITGKYKHELRDEIFALYDAIRYDNYTSHADAGDLISNLHNARNYWNWTENPDLQNISKTPLSSINEIGIYNCAAVFAVKNSKFTEGLDTELRELLKIIEENGEDFLRDSALYNWFYNTVPEVQINDRPILEPLPLNEEQKLAVKQSLQRPLTIIEGPPGTGKSQVVTSIILNALREKKSVFFSSKTNNAVSVVHERTNGITPYEILVKLGGDSQYTQLYNFFNNVLSREINEDDRNEFEDKANILENTINEFHILIKEEERMVADRNNCDKLEKKIETYRNKYNADIFKAIMTKDSSYFNNTRKSITTLKQNFGCINTSEFSILQKISWLFSKNKKLQAALDNFSKILNIGKDNYCRLRTFIQSEIEYDAAIKETQKLEKQIDELEEINKYFTSLRELEGYSFGDAAKKLNDLEIKLASISQKYIELWLKIRFDGLTQDTQNRIQNFITILALISPNPKNVARDVWRNYYSMFEEVKKYIPSMTVTSLSVNKRIPLQKGFFDILVIDEASACDIASVIPLLYRAQNAVIIGDKNQLNHITNMNTAEDTRLLSSNELLENDLKWAYSVNSVLNLSLTLNNSARVNLLNHHRSHPQIINFCNRYFYNENLRILTRVDNLRLENNNQIIRWINCEGECIRPNTGGAYNTEEINTVTDELTRLMQNNYEGSIGVVTPFTHQVTKIEDAINGNRQLSAWLSTREFLCDTAHGFQGDERDLIIFSTVISNNADPRTLGFLNSTGNLFNVAISRARASLIIVGNKEACLQSGVNYLENFVDYYNNLNNAIQRETEQHAINTPISEWEDIFNEMLIKSGIQASRQKNVDNYYLDFAIELENGKKLNIEIDGEYYHKNWNNELALRDRLRNRRLIDLGWDVQRFWVYQIRDDGARCINKVKTWIQENK